MPQLYKHTAYVLYWMIRIMRKSSAGKVANPVQLLKKCWHKLGGVNGLILILYATFALASHAVTIYVDYNRTFQYVARSLVNCACLAALCCPFLLRKLQAVSLKPEATAEHRKWVALSGGIATGYLLLAYIAHYPGGFNTDSLVQYEQAVTGHYVDWHPFLHTLLFFRLPLLLSGGWTGSIVLFQLLLMAAAMTYSIHTVLRHTNKTLALATLAFYLVNPNTVNLYMFPFKDNAFSIGAILLTAFSVNIFFTRGEWLRKPLRLPAFIVIFACTTCMRHNAILFTLPLLMAVLFFISRRSRLLVAISSLLLVLIVKVPLANALGVEAADQRKVETMGLPLNVIASVATYNPDALDDETRAFAYRIADQALWEECYTYGNFNHIKSDDRINLNAIEEQSVVNILKMTLRCLLRAPQEALAGLVSTTDPVYTLTDDYNAVFSIQVTKNDLGIQAGGVGTLAKAFALFTSLSSMVLSHLVHFIGAMMLLLIGVMLARSNLRRWEDWKRLFLALPVLAYNFGSMLLLTHRGDALRFFQYTFYLMPLYLIIFLTNRNEGNRTCPPVEKP